MHTFKVFHLELKGSGISIVSISKVRHDSLKSYPWSRLQEREKVIKLVFLYALTIHTCIKKKMDSARLFIVNQSLKRAYVIYSK